MYLWVSKYLDVPAHARSLINTSAPTSFYNIRRSSMKCIVLSANAFWVLIHQNHYESRKMSYCEQNKEKILAQFHNFVEIDHEIFSTAILLPFAESFKKGFCQLQANVCA